MKPKTARRLIPCMHTYLLYGRLLQQVPCDIPSEFPSLWPRMLELLRSLVEAAEPFMEHQAGTGHFEFLGLDVLADEMGGVWLIEGIVSM